MARNQSWIVVFTCVRYSLPVFFLTALQGLWHESLTSSLHLRASQEVLQEYWEEISLLGVWGFCFIFFTGVTLLWHCMWTWKQLLLLSPLYRQALSVWNTKTLFPWEIRCEEPHQAKAMDLAKHGTNPWVQTWVSASCSLSEDLSGLIVTTERAWPFKGERNLSICFLHSFRWDLWLLGWSRVLSPSCRGGLVRLPRVPRGSPRRARQNVRGWWSSG